MISSTSKESNALITERVCRIILDCKVKINEITPEMLRKSIYWNEYDLESALGHAEKQRQLLYALLRDARALDLFLTYVVANDFGLRMDANLDVRFHIEDEDLILKKVYSGIEGEKAPTTENDRDNQFLFETELFHACFTVDWSGTVLRKIKVVLGREDQEGEK